MTERTTIRSVLRMATDYDMGIAMADIDEPMQVMRCRVCNALLKHENIDFARGIASCGYCKAIMRFATDEGAPSFEARPEVAMPDQFRVENLGDEFHIYQGWFTYKIFALVLFTAFWCGISFTIFGAALLSGQIFGVLFTIPFISIGLFLIYMILCRLLNTTTISVARGRLTVRHAPLPYPGGGAYQAVDLKQLFCEENVSHGKNGATYRYCVGAIEAGGKRFTFLKNLHEPEQALFVEQRLEEHLGIRDAPVTGEMPR